MTSTSASSWGALERGQAFGLEIGASFGVPALVPLNAVRPPRRTMLEIVSAEELGARWSDANASTALERRDDRGRVGMRIEWGDGLGYRIAAPRHGRHIVSPDGRQIYSVLARIPVERWQRLLLAQVLPLAAMLQGFELFHASSVRMGDRTLAFIASSGAGKTSLAVQLLLRGADFVTDDVLSLEADGDSVVAYPGPGVVGFADADLDSLGRDRERLGPVLGRSDKAFLRVDPIPQATALDAIYFLHREQARGVEIVPISGDPYPLLSSSFISYITSPAYLVRHLDVCARIANEVSLFDLSIGPGATSAVVADAVQLHAARLA